MWGLKAWQIRQQREWIETLCTQRDTANREAESKRSVVKSLAEKVTTLSEQNGRLLRYNRAMRDQRRLQDEAVRTLTKQVQEMSQRLRDAGLETWGEAVKDAESGGVVMDLKLDPVTMGGFLSLVEAFGEERIQVHNAAGDLIVDEPAAPECPHTGWKSVPDHRPGTAMGDQTLVCCGCGKLANPVEDEPAAPQCTHPGLLDTRENGGEVVVCTTCGKTDTDEEGQA